MFRRLTGLLILFSFLWIKGGVSFDLQTSVKAIHSQHATSDDQDESGQNSGEDQKENKLLELADEFIEDHSYDLPELSVTVRKSSLARVPEVLSPSISIPSPPPNLS